MGCGTAGKRLRPPRHRTCARHALVAETGVAARAAMACRMCSTESHDDDDDWHTHTHTSVRGRERYSMHMATCVRVARCVGQGRRRTPE